MQTLEDVRREMARVYREARSRKMDPREASAYSYMLQNLAKMIEADVLERRIAALENGGAFPALPATPRYMGRAEVVQDE